MRSQWRFIPVTANCSSFRVEHLEDGQWVGYGVVSLDTLSWLYGWRQDHHALLDDVMILADTVEAS